VAIGEGIGMENMDPQLCRFLTALCKEMLYKGKPKSPHFWESWKDYWEGKGVPTVGPSLPYF